VVMWVGGLGGWCGGGVGEKEWWGDSSRGCVWGIGSE